MLKIKLARFGKRGQPHFRIIVNEARSKRDGQYIALLGHYAPTASPKTLDLDLKAYAEWLKKGAQPTDTVAALAKKIKSGNPFPEKAKRPSKKSVAKAIAAKEAKENPVPVEAAVPVEAEVAPTEAEVVPVETEESAPTEVAETPEEEIATTEEVTETSNEETKTE